MPREAKHELLPHHPCRSQHADVNPLHVSLQKQKTRLGVCRGGWWLALQGRSMVPNRYEMNL